MLRDLLLDRHSVLELDGFESTDEVGEIAESEPFDRDDANIDAVQRR